MYIYFNYNSGVIISRKKANVTKANWHLGYYYKGFLRFFYPNLSKPEPTTYNIQHQQSEKEFCAYKEFLMAMN